MPDATALWPYCSARLAVPEPVGLALKLMLLPALSVSVLADQVIGVFSVMSATAPVAVRFIALLPPSRLPLTVMDPTVASVTAPPTAVTLPLTVKPPALSAMLMAPALNDVVPRLVRVLDGLFSVTLAPLADSVETLVMAADCVMAPPVAVRLRALLPASTALLMASAPTVLKVTGPPTEATLPVTVKPPALSVMLMAPALELVEPRLVMVLEALFSVTLAPVAESVEMLVMAADCVMAPPVALRFRALFPASTVLLMASAPTVERVTAPPTAVTLPLMVKPPALSAMLMAPALELVVPRLVRVLDGLFSVTLAPLADRVETFVMAADCVMAPVVASVSACAAPLTTPLNAMAPLPAFSVASTPRVTGLAKVWLALVVRLPSSV